MKDSESCKVTALYSLNRLQGDVKSINWLPRPERPGHVYKLPIHFSERVSKSNLGDENNVVFSLWWVVFLRQIV